MSTHIFLLPKGWIVRQVRDKVYHGVGETDGSVSPSTHVQSQVWCGVRGGDCASQCTIKWSILEEEIGQSSSRDYIHMCIYIYACVDRQHTCTHTRMHTHVACSCPLGEPQLSKKGFTHIDNQKPIGMTPSQVYTPSLHFPA